MCCKGCSTCSIYAYCMTLSYKHIHVHTAHAIESNIVWIAQKRLHFSAVNLHTHTHMHTACQSTCAVIYAHAHTIDTLLKCKHHQHQPATANIHLHEKRLLKQTIANEWRKNVKQNTMAHPNLVALVRNAKIRYEYYIFFRKK